MHIGDVVQKNAMNSITAADLFAQAPAPKTLPLLQAWLGSAAWPTWRGGIPITSGTILGPDGATVPSFRPQLSGLGAPPAANLDQANATGLPVGPITILNPMPSIVQPAQEQTAPAPPGIACQIGNWASENPGLAVLSALGLFLVLKRRNKQ